MAKVLEKITSDNNDQPQAAAHSLQKPIPHTQTSPNNSNGTWSDPKDIRRKARKSISSQFTKNLFSGKFGDNWDRQQERFLRACNEWEITANDLVDYVQETVTGDALNYIDGKVEENPSITWNALSKLMTERYNNINRHKETSDRLHSMRFYDFYREGE